MNTIVKQTLQNEEREMRAVYCDTLCKLAQEDSRICVLDADLIGSSGMQPFFKQFPDRAIDCGIQEANMVGMAAGLSAAGMVPFAHSFAPFATRRVMDQIFISCAYGKQNVRIVGSDPGVTAAYNGGTHMPFEDMGCLMSQDHFDRTLGQRAAGAGGAHAARCLWRVLHPHASQKRGGHL